MASDEADEEETADDKQHSGRYEDVQCYGGRGRGRRGSWWRRKGSARRQRMPVIKVISAVITDINRNNVKM